MNTTKSRFDSKLVRLKVLQAVQGSDECRRFDSKLVRLKALILLFTAHAFAGFRFQTGSIKRKLEAIYGEGALFRFQTGSIKRLDKVYANTKGYESFDSKLVRLKEWRKEKGYLSGRFRFQTGSIKR